MNRNYHNAVHQSSKHIEDKPLHNENQDDLCAIDIHVPKFGFKIPSLMESLISIWVARSKLKAYPFFCKCSWYRFWMLFFFQSVPIGDE